MQRGMLAGPPGCCVAGAGWLGPVSHPSGPHASPQPHRRPVRTHRRVQAQSWFDPPPFNAAKLSVSFSPGQASQPQQHCKSRRYTLTHNDLTGALQLSVGPDFNHSQISGFYTRLLRDEVVAEWNGLEMGHGTIAPSLHVYCHVSGEERWLAPPLLRNYIFRRELPLVLDTFTHADRDWLNARPHLASAEVLVHFQSSQPDLDVVEPWGLLGERSTWQPVPESLVRRGLAALGFLAASTPPPQRERQQMSKSEWQQLPVQQYPADSAWAQPGAHRVSGQAHSSSPVSLCVDTPQPTATHNPQPAATTSPQAEGDAALGTTPSIAERWPSARGAPSWQPAIVAVAAAVPHGQRKAGDASHTDIKSLARIEPSRDKLAFTRVQSVAHSPHR